MCTPAGSWGAGSPCCGSIRTRLITYSTEMTDGGIVSLESGVADAVRRELQRRGHRLQESLSFGGYQAIMWDPEQGVYYGASESRKDGHAAGY